MNTDSGIYVPAPAVRLMKSRVLSRPGVNSVPAFHWSFLGKAGEREAAAQERSGHQGSMKKKSSKGKTRPVHQRQGKAGQDEWYFPLVFFMEENLECGRLFPWEASLGPAQPSVS